MFLGEFQHTVDAKGRLIIPSKFRDALGEQFVIAKGLEGCLFIYPLPEWQTLAQKLRSLPLTQKDARAFTRFFFSGASEEVLDKQGRVIIPPGLREFAGIEKDVMVIGVDERMEIWDMAKWQQYNEGSGQSYEALAEMMGQYGIVI